jgi:hypothetical protein
MFSYPQPEPISSAYKNEQSSKPTSRLGYATNNIYPDSPSIMCDSRSIIASYQPEAILNDNLIKQSGVKTNWEYRKYLTENSQEIASVNFKEACNDCGYFERFRISEQGGNNLNINNGRSYKEQSTIMSENSDLKKLYLTREELSKKHEHKNVTQEQLYSYMNKN